MSDDTDAEGDTHKKLVFLMRHEMHRNGELNDNAKEEIRGVSDRFAGWLRAYPGAVEVAYVGGREVADTAALLVHWTSSLVSDDSAFERVSEGDLNGITTKPEGARPPAEIDGSQDSDDRFSWDEFDEVALGPHRPDGSQIEFIRSWLDEVRLKTDQAPSRRLFVGNDPLVSWLTAELAGPLGIAHGELVCLEPRHAVQSSWRSGSKWRVVWTAAPRDDTQVDAIVAKVKSKMSTAGSLGAIITGLLVFLLKDGVDRGSLWSWLALAAFAGSAILYFVTLFFYDSLSMPSRFWGSRRGPKGNSALRRIQFGRSGLRRPPTSTARLLQDAMVHIWTWLFLPATMLAGIGVALLIGAQAWPSPKHAKPLEPGAWGPIAAAVYTLALILYAAAHRPRLGASD